MAHSRAQTAARREHVRVIDWMLLLVITVDFECFRVWKRNSNATTLSSSSFAFFESRPGSVFSSSVSVVVVVWW